MWTLGVNRLIMYDNYLNYYIYQLCKIIFYQMELSFIWDGLFIRDLDTQFTFLPQIQNTTTLVLS